MKNGDTHGNASTENVDTVPDFDYAKAACEEFQSRLTFLLERAGQMACRLPSIRPVHRPSALAGLCHAIADAEEAMGEFRRVLDRISRTPPL